MSAQNLIIGVGDTVPQAAPPTPEIADLVALARVLGAPEGEPGTDDFNLLVEHVLRAKIAMEHHPHHLLWVRQYGPKTSPQTAKNLATGEVCDLADIPGGRLFSPISTADPVPAQELLVDGRGYSSLPCWPELSGRFSAQVTIPEDAFGEADYTEIIQAVRTAAARSAQNIAVIKIIAKDKVAPPAHLRIGPGMTDEDVQQLINRAFDDFWIVYRYTGITDAFLVQAHVQMEFEYRFFIVDGVPVTGAACIEEHTPLDNAGHPFDVKVRQHRLARTPVHDAPAGLID